MSDQNHEDQSSRDDNETAGKLFILISKGSGKTACAEQFARESGASCEKIDGGNYLRGRDLARIFGLPPGHPGRNEAAGVLSDFQAAMRGRRCGVLIIEEDEKLDAALARLRLQGLKPGAGESKEVPTKPSVQNPEKKNGRGPGR
jgi:ATP-dependent Clp protease ATP-binding subunit ClpA